MLSSDRTEFEGQLGTLCAGFNVPMTDLRTEAYWRGLAKMQLSQFARVVEHALGAEGPERIPTATQCWSISRQFRTQRPSAANAAPPESRPFDPMTAFGNRCLFRFLREVGGTDERTLRRLVDEKNRVARNFAQIATEEKLSADEVREAMLKAFRRTAHAQAVAR